MKVEAVWADIASQNATLKIATICLSLAIFSTAILATYIGLKDPLVIDRACNSVVAQVANAANQRPNENELEQFLKEALAMRFSTNVEPDLNYLTVTLVKARLAEQEDYARKRISQNMVVQSVKVAGETALVEADRIVAVDKLRSAFPVTFLAKVASTKRSAANPYGLVLTSVELKLEVPSK